MSVHVMSWALRESDAELGDRLVLIVLADHAREDGTGAWPSLETIASQSRLSERQVRRCLRNLEASGDIVETGRSRKGTHIYSFPKYINRGDNMTPPGGTSTSQGGDMMTPDPSLDPLEEQVLAAAPRNSSNGNGKTRPVNEVWEALEYVFGPVTAPTALSKRGKVCRDLQIAHATRDQIVARASAWPAHFDSATLTPEALEKHWDTLARKPLRRQ